MAAVYFLRHGFTDTNKKEIVAGVFEARLLPEGFEQARQAGIFLKDKGIKKIFCSPLIRTRETYRSLNLDGVPVEFDARLQEINCGVHEGALFSTVPPEFQFENLWKNPHIPHPKGESILQVKKRICSFVEEKLKKSNETVLIVGHGGSGITLIMELSSHLDLAKYPITKRGIIFNGEIAKMEGNRFEKVFLPTIKSI